MAADDRLGIGQAASCSTNAKEMRSLRKFPNSLSCLEERFRVGVAGGEQRYGDGFSARAVSDRLTLFDNVVFVGKAKVVATRPSLRLAVGLPRPITAPVVARVPLFWQGSNLARVRRVDDQCRNLHWYNWLRIHH